MKAVFKGFLISIYIFVLTSCDRPECQNRNTIFDNNAPESEVYKRELASKLHSLDNSELTYWFDHYTRLDNRDFIYVHIQGQDLCAIAALSVDHWTGIQDIQRTAGKGYRGAELVDLEIKIVQKANSTDLAFSTVRKIRD